MIEKASEFGGPLECPLCERIAEGDAWPTHEKFGFRMCPVCRRDGFTIIPGTPTDAVREEWEQRNNTGW